MTTKVEITNKGPDRIRIRIISVTPAVAAIPASEGVAAQDGKPEEHVLARSGDLAVGDVTGFYVHGAQYVSVSELKPELREVVSTVSTDVDKAHDPAKPKE